MKPIIAPTIAEGTASENSNERIVIEDTRLNQFAYKTFRHLFDIDRFQSFWDKASNVTTWNDASFRNIKDAGRRVYLSGVFRADKGDEGKYFQDGFEIDGHIWYLSASWCKQEFVPNRKYRYGLSAVGLQRLIDAFYPSYRMEISDDGYRFIRTTPSTAASFQSANLSEFWNHVGKSVLKVDDDFSRLPLYYHKGHIRVKTNYGGACNFSVGFYDARSGRVNTSVTFEYNKRTDSENEHTFYLNIETKDPQAFEKFIPVFNNSYAGLFKISFDGTTYVLRDLRESPAEPYRSNRSRQVIYFGAPGTGKSYAVNKIVQAEAPKRNVRTTFHPDTDYSSFVGCYKPTMRDGRIEYSFTAQAFVNAYIGAWNDLSQPFYLIIEEINRGNCAQIFGDIFQLLDRNDEGESNYEIKPDADLQAYIESKLGLLTNLPEKIRSGEEMKLPANLFIYATMNTSDQSLFPIDSAFKRRWDMRYTAIRPSANDHVITVGPHRYNWTSFIRNVNKKILSLTKSEDKQLGYWFIQPDSNGEIDWERFVSKAVFYIWNDVVKDYATMEKEDSAFGRNYAFTTFFDEDGNPLIDQTIAYLDKLEVEKLPPVIIEPDYPYINDEDIDDSDDPQEQSEKDHTLYQS